MIMRVQIEKLGARVIESGPNMAFIYGGCIYSITDCGGGRWDVSLHDAKGWGAVTRMTDDSSSVIGKIIPRPGFVCRRNGGRFEYHQSSTPNENAVRILSSQDKFDSLLNFIKKDNWRTM